MWTLQPNWNKLLYRSFFSREHHLFICTSTILFPSTTCSLMSVTTHTNGIGCSVWNHSTDKTHRHRNPDAILLVFSLIFPAATEDCSCGSFPPWLLLASTKWVQLHARRPCCARSRESAMHLHDAPAAEALDPLTRRTHPQPRDASAGRGASGSPVNSLIDWNKRVPRLVLAYKRIFMGSRLHPYLCRTPSSLLPLLCTPQPSIPCRHRSALLTGWERVKSVWNT